MLVIIGDLHLTDGTSGQTIKENAFRIFTERVRDMALDASFRQDNTYEPIDRIDILLLGDILDVIRSTAWLQEGVTARPWSDPSNNAFIKKVKDISDEILEHNKSSLNHLKKLSQDNGLTLPPSDDTGTQPDYKKSRLPVAVKIHYMVGNHDWFYHLPGDSYNPLRQNVVRAMGLANDFEAGFPHDPEESEGLADVLREHEVPRAPRRYLRPVQFCRRSRCVFLGRLHRRRVIEPLPVGGQRPDGAGTSASLSRRFARTGQCSSHDRHPDMD